MNPSPAGQTESLDAPTIAIRASGSTSSPMAKLMAASADRKPDRAQQLNAIHRAFRSRLRTSGSMRTVLSTISIKSVVTGS